jgi:hypothetical protein
VSVRDWSHALAEDVAEVVQGQPAHLAVEALLALGAGMGRMTARPGEEGKCRETWEKWARRYYELAHTMPVQDVTRTKTLPQAATLSPAASLLADRCGAAIAKRVHGWQQYGSPWAQQVALPEMAAIALLCAAGCALRTPVGWNPWVRLALEAWDAGLYSFEIVPPEDVEIAANG